MTQPQLPKVATFTFVLDTETKEAQLYGNLDPQVALSLLQGLVIDIMVRQRTSENGGTPDEAQRVPLEPTP